MSTKKTRPLMKRIAARDLMVEPEAKDMLDSPAMKPYMNLAAAIVGGKDTGEAIEEITALPLEKRYVWRIASALKWAFADYDSLGVAADRESLSSEDKRRLLELVEYRPHQFCLFLSKLFGEQQMAVMIASAFRFAKAVAQSDQAAER